MPGMTTLVEASRAPPNELYDSTPEQIEISVDVVEHVLTDNGTPAPRVSVSDIQRANTFMNICEIKKMHEHTDI